MESEGLLSGVDSQATAGYTKVIGALATGAIIVCGGSGYFSGLTQVESNDARFDIVVDHTLDGTPNDNVTCVCDEGFEADDENDECREIDPCADDNTNNCHDFGGTCNNWDPPAEYDPGYQCDCWWGYANTNNDQECEPVPCPTLTIENSIDCIGITGVLPNEDQSCDCQDGYGPDSTFTMDCDPSGPGASSWYNEKTCLPVPCPNLDVDNSSHEGVDTKLVTLESTTVTCHNGYELSTGSGCTFEAVCTAASGPTSEWLLANGEQLPACVPVACDPVDIANSGANGNQSGLVTGDFLSVTCDPGYEDLSTGSFAFTMSCDPESCDDNSWSGDQPCEPSKCGEVYVANSQDGVATDYDDDVESDVRHIQCADGFYPTADSTGDCTVARDCDPVAPGNAAYTGSDTCERVVCDAYVGVFVADTVAGYNPDGTQFQSDTCIDGYGTAAVGGNGDYKVECIPDGPCGREWDVTPACEPIECGDLSSAFSSDYQTATYTGSVTGESVTITCADGYETSVGGCTYDATCTGDAPNSNYWEHADACQLVACHDDIEIDFSTSSVTSELTFDSTTVTCINGYWDASTSTGSFDLYCAPIPCDNEWTGHRDCTPTPCPSLTVPNTDTSDENTGADVTDPYRTAQCQDGYEPDGDAGDCSVARTCDSNAPATAYWTGADSCNPKACDDATLEALDRNSLTSSDGFNAVVTCDNGWAYNGAGGFTSACQPLAPCSVDWDNQYDCVCVDCPSDTFAYSSHAETGISGCTEQSDVVTCDDGYCSSDGPTFTLTCTGDAPASVFWDGVDSCEPSSCGPLNIANSNQNGTWSGNTGEWIEATCDDGYHSNDCTSVIITCEPSGPCSSTYDHSDFQCVADEDLL
jgi:hypothetical protein